MAPPEGKTPEFDPALDEDERHEAKERAAARAYIIHEVVRREGEEELNRGAYGLAWSGLAAGLSMGFSMIAEGLLRARLPHAEWTPLVSKVGYTVGFILVILGRQQLYTENTLTPVVPFMADPTRERGKNLLRLWVIVLFTNILGAFGVAWASTRAGIFDPNVQREFLELGREAMSNGFAATVAKGIFGGWLIATIGWVLGGMRESGVFVILLLSYLVGIGHFSHVVAGSVEALALVVTGNLGMGRYLTHFLVPACIGNTIGGVTLVAMVNHAQVVAGRKERRRIAEGGAPRDLRGRGAA